MKVTYQKDFTNELNIIREELNSYGIKFTEEFDDIFEALTFRFSKGKLKCAIFIRKCQRHLKAFCIKGKRRFLIHFEPEIVFDWSTSTEGGMYGISFSASKGLDQDIFEFLDNRGFDTDIKPQQLSFNLF